MKNFNLFVALEGGLEQKLVRFKLTDRQISTTMVSVD